MQRFMQRASNNERTWTLPDSTWSALRRGSAKDSNLGQLSLLQHFAIAAWTFDLPLPAGYITKQILEKANDVVVLSIPPRESSDVVIEGMFQIWPDAAKALLVIPPI